MISALELRHMIEKGLLPRSCTCTVNHSGSMMIKMVEPASGHVDLFDTGVLAADLNTSRAIANLIGGLRSEIAARQARVAGVIAK